VYTHLQKRAWKRAAEVALGSMKLSKFKISDGDLSSSSTRPSSSFASDASRPGPAMCDIVPVSPSQSSDGAPPSKSSPRPRCHPTLASSVDAPALQRRRPLRRRRERGGRGRLVASPAQEPSLDLAGQVSLERHVAGLVEHLKGCCFLLEVEQAACKKSRLSWAVCMQDQFQPIIYIIISEGPPTD
jgi:hypothetical protein